VSAIVNATPATDMHTHLFAPEFGSLNLSGADELLTYHYLSAEYFRAPRALKPAEFWNLSKREQADRIWRALFIEATPVSEAASGVVEIFSALGLDPAAPNLAEARASFAAWAPAEQVGRVLSMAHL